MRVAWCSMTVASMSMIEQALGALRERLGRLRRDAVVHERPHGEATIVPRDTIAGSALTAVVAIMTFLAAATSGGVAMVIRSHSGSSGSSSGVPPARGSVMAMSPTRY